MNELHTFLAGFQLAHALWSVDDGSTLVTLALAADTSVPFDRSLPLPELLKACDLRNARVPGEIREAVAHGRGWLTGPENTGRGGVLVYDGFWTDAQGRTDALFVEVLAGPKPVLLVQRYRPASHPEGFAPLGPPFRAVATAAGPRADPDPVLAARVLEGVRAHDAAWAAVGPRWLGLDEA